jgi:hypothetical protein
MLSQYLSSAAKNTDLEAWLTLVCSVVSMASLLACLILHLVFPSLLNVPSKMFFNLALALLGAHATFLLSGAKNLPGLWCPVVGGIQHFLWLSTFTWMTCMSSHLYANIRSLVKSSTETESKCLKYFLAAWLLPLLAVAACTSLHVTGHFTYGGIDSCWIVGQLDLGLAIALPVACCIAVNIVLFSLTVNYLRRAMDESSTVNSQYNIKYRLFVYVKMSLLVRGTWILGFLSNAPYLGSLRYPFIVLSCLNGFFVSAFFTFNTRFFKAVKERSGWFQSTQPNTSSTASGTASSK